MSKLQKTWEKWNEGTSDTIRYFKYKIPDNINPIGYVKSVHYSANKAKKTDPKGGADIVYTHDFNTTHKPILAVDKDKNMLYITGNIKLNDGWISNKREFKTEDENGKHLKLPNKIRFAENPRGFARVGLLTFIQYIDKKDGKLYQTYWPKRKNHPALMLDDDVNILYGFGNLEWDGEQIKPRKDFTDTSIVKKNPKPKKKKVVAKKNKVKPKTKNKAKKKTDDIFLPIEHISFPKNKFTISEAEKWLKENKYKIGKHEDILEAEKKGKVGKIAVFNRKTVLNRRLEKSHGFDFYPYPLGAFAIIHPPNGMEIHVGIPSDILKPQILKKYFIIKNEELENSQAKLAKNKRDPSTEKAKNEEIEDLKAILAKNKRDPSTIQSVNFNKKDFTLAKAKKWLKANKMKYGIHETTKNYYRFRQKDKKDFQEKGWGTIELTPEIQAAIGRLQKTKRKKYAKKNPKKPVTAKKTNKVTTITPRAKLVKAKRKPNKVSKPKIKNKSNKKANKTVKKKENKKKV